MWDRRSTKRAASPGGGVEVSYCTGPIVSSVPDTDGNTYDSDSDSDSDSGCAYVWHARLLVTRA